MAWIYATLAGHHHGPLAPHHGTTAMQDLDIDQIPLDAAQPNVPDWVRAAQGSERWSDRVARGLYYRGRALRDRFDRDRWRGWLKHRVWKRLAPQSWPPGMRLHVGCGKERLEGWCNIDMLALPHVDVCLNVTRGLPFRDASRVYAEHFLEHLEVLDAFDFLAASHRCLSTDGWIRLSTPNLDWVWTHLYSGPASGEHIDQRLGKAIQLNRAFYGWQHRFLWNREMLTAALEAHGFEDLHWCRHGESQLEDLRGIERHELYDDTPELPHVLVVEARKGLAKPDDAAALRQLLEHRFVRCRI